jgi:hypothetical protein
MTLFANFSESGECMYVGEVPGETELPSQFTFLFPKRYKRVNGVITDQYAGKTDAEAEAQWHTDLDAKREAAKAAAEAAAKT